MTACRRYHGRKREGLGGAISAAQLGRPSEGVDEVRQLDPRLGKVRTLRAGHPQESRGAVLAPESHRAATRVSARVATAFGVKGAFSSTQ